MIHKIYLNHIYILICSSCFNTINRVTLKLPILRSIDSTTTVECDARIDITTLREIVQNGINYKTKEKELKLQTLKPDCCNFLNHFVFDVIMEDSFLRRHKTRVSLPMYKYLDCTIKNITVKICTKYLLTDDILFLSSINPTIDKGIQVSGIQKLNKMQAIVLTKTKEIPPPVGIAIL